MAREFWGREFRLSASELESSKDNMLPGPVHIILSVGPLLVQLCLAGRGEIGTGLYQLMRLDLGGFSMGLLGSVDLKFWGPGSAFAA